MADDIIKPAGASKASKPDAGGGVIRSVPVFGVVKNNVDPTRAGRLQVYVTELGSDDPDSPDGWVTVSYMTPFYGSVEPTAGETGDGDFAANPASYGMWNSPPDLGTTVICIFINGDPNYGFWIGCVPKPEALHMVPAIGSSQNIITNNNSEAQSYGGAEQLPVTNINSNNPAVADGNNFLDEPKPVHSYIASILFKQGLIRDPLRGTITTSAQRESPSRVGWGVSSPGRPIFAGGYTDASIVQAAQSGKDSAGMTVISRRGGHSFVMDDGDLVGRDQLVRMRSSSGHQILMSDDGQTIFIIHGNGQSWIEMGKEGTIDMFCTNSFNVRTQGDINFHADTNINIHAKKKLNIKAEDITIQSEKSTSHKVGTDYKIETSGKYNLKVGGTMSFQSGGEGSFNAGGTCYINGSRVNLNTGQGAAPDAVPPLQDIGHTDTMFESVKGYIAAPGTLKSITSRAPAHAPWSNANQGVNVSTSSNASDNLPDSPSSNVEQANEAASVAPTGNPVQPAALSTVPATPAVSEAMDPQATAATVSAVATNAATGAAAAAVATGSGIVQTAQGQVASLGALAQSPAQLEAAGILKPGSSALVDSLVKSGSPLSQALPNNLFTGQGGISSLTSFVGNQGAQISGMVSNLQKSQTALTGAGLISGKESSTSIAGLIMSGATAGISNTINAVKNLGTLASNISLPSLGLPGVTNPITNAISSGNYAAGLAQSSTGGLGSIMSTVLPVAGLIAGSKLNSKGSSAAAFGLIAASLTALPRGPVNLRSNSNANYDLAVARSSGYNDPFNSAAKLLKTTGQILGGRNAKVTSAVAGGITAIGKLNGANTPSQALTGLTGVLGSIGSIGSALGNKSIAKASRDVNAIIGVSKQLNKNLSTIANAKTASQALGGLIGVFGGVGRGASIFGNKNVLNRTRDVNKILTNTGQILRASNVLATSKNVNQTLGAYGSIINAAGRIAGVFGKNSKSTGLFGIPGGQLSVGSIVNKSLGSLGIPKNPALNSIITNAVTGAINKIAFPSAVKGAAGLAAGLPNLPSGLPGLPTSQITNALSSLQSAGQNLTGLALNDLTLGEAGPLNAAMSAIGFGGAGAIKMPSIGLNTNDVAEVNGQINSLLEDSRIPRPDFGDVDESAVALLDAILAQNDQIDSAFEEIDSLTVEVESAREEYFTLENNLPPGSPEVESAREAWIALSQDLEDKLESINGVINQAAANNEQSEQTFAGYTGPSVVYAADGTSSPVDSLGNAIRPLINGNFGTG
jgi:hypothetical protein